jgi:DNA-binding FadR family transcriptional regulator
MASILNMSKRETPVRIKKHAAGLHHRVIHDLGLRIVGGEFAAGSPLPGQDECCRLLGVSRSVLREALRVLAAKGLVGARPKAGTFVKARDAWNFLDPDVLEWRLASSESDKVMDQLYELRQMVEPVAASLAASKAKLGDLQRMGQAYDEMAQAGDGDEVVEPDLKFHRAMIAASGNDLFASLGRAVEAALLVSFRIGTDNPQGQHHSLQMHKAVLDAIVERDGAAARLAMQKLIEYSRQTVLQIRGSRREKRPTKTSSSLKATRRRVG